MTFPTPADPQTGQSRWKIAALSKTGTSRIAWFGEVAFPNRLLKSKHPSIQVQLSQVIAENWREDPSLLLRPESFSPRTRTCWVSVGTLTLLRQGDIWAGGTWAASPSYEFHNFKDLEIGPETVTLAKAGIADGGQFVLPFAEHPWHSDDTHSYCVIVQLAEGRQLVIPCVELIRFYFGSSSPLLHKVFAPPLQKESLAAQLTREHGEKLSLSLARGLPGASAPHIARMMIDETAWRAVTMVGSSCLRSSTLGGKIYPQTFFPFVGKTTLTASGKWLSSGTNPRSTFLVYSLRTCSARFPFSSLEYRTSVEMGNGKQGKGAKESDRRKKRPKDDPDPTFVEADGSDRFTPKTFYVNTGNPFIDLKRKPIWASRLIHALTCPSVSNPDSKPVTEAGIGEAVGGDQRVRAIDLVDLQGKPRPKMPGYLRGILGVLRGLDGVKIDLLTASNDDGWSVPINWLLNEDGVMPELLFVETPDVGSNLRTCVVFMLTYFEKKAVLISLEATPPEAVLGEVHSDSFEGIRTSIYGALGCNNHIGRTSVEGKEQFAAWLRECLATTFTPPVEQAQTVTETA